MTGLRPRLRQATAAAHARLEAAMRLDAAQLDLGRYGRALQVLHGVRTGWAAGFAAIWPGWGEAERAWLAMDLAALRVAPIAPAPDLGLAGTAEAWGARYVLEGSALGGRVLLAATRRLGLSPRHGARYFEGAGAETGARWAAFLAAMDAAAPDQPAALHGACAAFAAITAYAAAVSEPPRS